MPACCLPFAADQVIRLFGDGAAGRGAEADDFGVDPVAGEVLKFSCRYNGASCKSFVTYRKPRAVSNEQREQARQRMTKLNSAGN